jgi:hypothetical protein
MCGDLYGGWLFGEKTGALVGPWVDGILDMARLVSGEANDSDG